ncbi:hypothetical protein BGW38_008322 [Lunasporangiospora selenospora]|uniref:Uncharacterized protein n=1 Tax=Lunasporangiospora selenospora TaxID=979761 RepID=A0A9P6G391_9FUNG|nr:hypothetical protein BGW38_008322 [Lunasporangiospora selenospora]
MVVPTLSTSTDMSPSVVPESVRVGRASIDSYDRSRYFKPTASDTITLPKSSRHKKSSSSPSSLLSQTLEPMDPSQSANAPSLMAEGSSRRGSISQCIYNSIAGSSSITSSRAVSSSTPPTPFLSIPSVVRESEEAKPLEPAQSESDDNNNPSDVDLPHRRTSEDSIAGSTAAAATTGSVSSMFFGRISSSVSNTPVATPPASPALRAASTAINRNITQTSINPSPSTTPPSSPSPSFLAALHGRSRSFIPSPMMPFRAAKKVVTSVTSVGTGLLPSKEQLGSIPVAGRILKHPVMDSTLTYIASKTALISENKTVAPEDIHYRKLNRKLVDQAMTLASLALEKEEQSKTVDDEAGDDAFELYLASINTLMHALPFETCDLLRREAFEIQLRNFLDECQIESEYEETTTKELRKRRRHRHRQYRHQAASLIDHHLASISAANNTSPGVSSTSPPSTSDLSRSKQSSKKSRRSNRRKRRNQNQGGGADSDDGAGSEQSPTLSQTIISTAVESAIRLKQSPIPDVIKTCYRASRLVLSKVDERFHLQERAWQISKSSIEKAIELDEQYSIHEVVSETFFATVTGLIKAGIAYKETPGYSTLRSLNDDGQQDVQGRIGGYDGPPQLQITAATPPSSPSKAPQQSQQRSRNPQEIAHSRFPSSSSTGSSSSRRRYSVIEEVDEDGPFIARSSDRDEKGGRSSSSSSSFTTSSGSDANRSGESGDSESDCCAEGGPGLDAYKDKVREKIDLFMTLRGAASLLIGGHFAK